jgi:hypothetical protein
MLTTLQTRPLLLAILLAGSTSLVGCTGVVGGAPGESGTPPNSAGSPGGQAGASNGGSGGTTSSVPSTVVGPSAGRRLTKAEYLHTVQDLLGVDLSGATDAGLPDDQPPTGAGFRNDINGLLPTSVRTDAYEALAIRAATTVVWQGRLASYASCTETTDACKSGFVQALGRVLYRRPLTNDDTRRLTPLFAEADPKDGFEGGARLVLQAMLQAPHFLYRLERLDSVDAAGKHVPTPFELATRLAYLAWQSAPSPELLDAAARGDLSGSAYGATVDGLLSHANALRGFQGYAEDWLQLYRLASRTPNEDQGVSPALLTEMKEELVRFTTRVAFTEGRALGSLFTDKKTEVGPALAQVYGLTAPSGQGFASVDLASDPHRVGILTQPGFLILRAAPERATIVHRGLMVLRVFLCSEVPAPPANAATQADSIPTNLTDRERFALHKKSPTCSACHQVFDPLGEPFEPFDLAGHFRTQDEFGNNLRSDGDVMLDQQTLHYADTAEFAKLLAQSPSVDRCFVSKLLQYGLGRTLRSEDASSVDTLSQAFKSAGSTYTAALSAVAKSDAFRAPAPNE